MVRKIALRMLLLAGGLAFANPAAAQELLVNRSYETPVAPALGNNFYATIPNWAITSVPLNPQPVNLIRPHAGYTGNPTATPTGGGTQYFDINAASGTLRQSVTIAAGMVDFSAWFSVRDNQQDLSGLIVNIRDSSDAVVATVSTSFVLADPIGLWKQAAATNVPLAAGTYTFEIILPNPANTDLASMVWKPPLTITKSSSAWSDPYNATTNPKLIPGALAEYLITVANPATYSVSSNSVQIVDATPANTDLSVVDIGAVGSGPAAFVQGAPSSTLTYTFTSLANLADDIEFSSNGGTIWTYVPTANANGVDTAVTHIRLRPKGTMAASSSFRFRVRYRVR